VFISASSIDTILAWSWSGPNGFTGSGDTIGVNATGSYIVTATGTNGCTAKDTTQVQAGQGLPQITASGATINCIQTEVMLIGAATNGASLQWSGPDGFTSSTSAPTVSTPGDYTLTASLGLNCTVDTTVSVLLDTLSPELLLQADTIDCSQTEATLNGSSSLPATYIWSGPGGYSSNMPAATATAPGWYTLNATADNGCSAQDSVLVVEDTTPPMIDVQGGTLSCDVTTLALQANSLAGALYEWSGPSGFASTEQQPAVSEAGLYILTLTGLNACSAVDTAVVLADTTTPSVQLLADTLTCAQQQVPINVVGAVPGLSYTWSGPDAFSSSLISPVVNQPGLYELQIEGINGCTAVDTAFVQADTLSPQLQLTSDTLTCAQTQIQIAVTADLSDLNYVWSGPNGFSSSLMQPFIETPGSYVLTAVASNGCSRTDSIRIVEDVALPQLQASGGALSCADTEVTLAGSSDGADDVLVWSGPGGFSQVADTVVTSQEGIYTLVATAANACQDSLQVSVPVDTVAPSISLAASNMLTCAMPEAVLQAEGVGEGYELIWSLGQNNLPATTDTAQVNAAGDYQLVAIDGSNGCADTAFLAVTIDTLSPQVFAEVIGNLDCLTDTVTLVGGSGGPVSFLWSTVDGLFGESPAQATTTATAPGDYLLTVEDSENGCQATDTVNVWENTAQPENIALAIFPPQCTSSTGSFRVLAVEGGTAPYLYALDDGPFAAIDSFGQLPPGTYELMVEDANGCRTSQSVLIPEPLPLTVALPMDIELGFSEAYQFNPVLNFPESIIASVNWSPADYLSCTDCLRPLAEQAREDIVYTLTIETDQGCTVSAQLSVKVLQERSIYVPNAFSPGNADGRNDYFTVYASANEVARIKRLAVFDRWGAQVFERQDFPPSEPSQGWDGGYRGEKAPSGTYVYWLEVEFVDGKTLLQKGELMLLR
jgi:gliding motility-associated-like protein